MTRFFERQRAAQDFPGAACFVCRWRLRPRCQHDTGWREDQSCDLPCPGGSPSAIAPIGNFGDRPVESPAIEVMCLESCMSLGSGRESEKQSGGNQRRLIWPRWRHSATTAPTSLLPTPVALRKIGKFNGGCSKKFAAVNSGRSARPPPWGQFFRLGISQDSLILGPITGARLPPVIPPHPPYLVFDSGTRTNP